MFCFRFDLEGRLILDINEAVHDRALYHHGEEPNLPSYSIDELLILIRSSAQQQKILAMNVLAKIAENCHAGNKHFFKVVFTS